MTHFSGFVLRPHYPISHIPVLHPLTAYPGQACVDVGPHKTLIRRPE